RRSRACVSRSVSLPRFDVLHSGRLEGKCAFVWCQRAGTHLLVWHGRFWQRRTLPHALRRKDLASGGVLGAAIALLLGAVLGILAGFYGKWTDAILMRCLELFLALPWLYLLFAVRA